MSGTLDATRARTGSTHRTYAEDRIQAAIVAFLRTVLVNAKVAAIPNGGLRSKAEAAKLKWTGVLAGIPDLFIVAPFGRAYFIEVKSEKGQLSPAQRAINTWFAANGVSYAVCRSIEDARVAIQHWQLPTREAA